MEISDLYRPLEDLKKQLKDMDQNELKEYVATLSEARRRGPVKVARSKATGAPTRSRVGSPTTKFEALFSGMSEQEKEALLQALEVDSDEG